jgi:acetyl-CoA acetyltransferase
VCSFCCAHNSLGIWLYVGLWDPYNDWHMGSCAELCAEQYGITRQQMDDHAVAAFERAQAAAGGSHRDSEVVGVEIPPARPGQAARWLTEDESLAKLNPDKLRKLQPHFKQDGGSVTAGNSSPITDGASAMVLMSAQKAQQVRRKKIKQNLAKVKESAGQKKGHGPNDPPSLVLTGAVCTGCGCQAQHLMTRLQG